MKTNHGLTLVEVLVTLAIIGMVAAIVIPPVVRSSGKRQQRRYAALTSKP